MDNLINLIISIVSGALAGGITSYSLVNKHIQKSKSVGKNSPIIDRDANGSHFGDNQ